MRSTKIIRKCIVCNNNFRVRRKGSKKLCSYVCAGKYQSSYRVKDKNPNWKGGNWCNLSKEIRIRDNYTCQICGLREPEIMEVDHIKPKKSYPELKLEPTNLITLCPNCHRRKTIREKK